MSNSDDRNKKTLPPGDDDAETTIDIDLDDLQGALDEPGEYEPYLIFLTGSELGHIVEIEDGAIVLGRSSAADVTVQDAGVSREHARLRREGDDIWVEDLGSSNGTFVNHEEVASERKLEEGDRVALGKSTVLKFALHDAVEKQFTETMRSAARRDGLTGAYNREALDEVLEKEFSYARRHQSPLALIVFDLDHFKQVNDTYGHVAGDIALKAVAAIVHGAIRTEDYFARYGGEEFVIVSRATTDEMVGLGERLRSLIDEAEIRHEGQSIDISVSVGVASFPEVEASSENELISAADRALYAAKEGGRNRTVSA